VMQHVLEIILLSQLRYIANKNAKLSSG